MMQINRLMGQELARSVHAVKKQCFRNAVMALGSYRGGAEAYYVEGILLIWERSLQTDHDWLEIDGEIVDPTLNDCDAIDYYPVFRWSHSEIQHFLEKRLTLPYYVHDMETRRQFREFAFQLFYDTWPKEETTTNER